MVVLNSPHNPTGHVATREELEALGQVCVEHNLLAVSDEVYEHCVFPAADAASNSAAAAAPQHHQLAAVEGMRERTITLGSGGKLFSLTGWRVAWALGPASLVAPLGQAHTHYTFSAPTPLQAGVAAALDVDDGLDDIAPLFAENFSKLSAALKQGCPHVKSVCAAQGGYFLVAETDGLADVEFCRWLAETKGVACTPMSVFYATPWPADAPCTLVRFTVCKSKELIDLACQKLLAKPQP